MGLRENYGNISIYVNIVQTFLLTPKDLEIDCDTFCGVSQDEQYAAVIDRTKYITLGY